MHMCTVATTPPFDAHAHRCNESDCCCFNGLYLERNCKSFCNYTNSKGVSMETVETPLDPPLNGLEPTAANYICVWSCLFCFQVRSDQCT